MKISPTLVVDKLNIENFYKKEELLIYHVRIYNMFGIQVFETKNNKSNILTLNLSSLGPGIYIVKVFDNLEEVVQIKKIIKK